MESGDTQARYSGAAGSRRLASGGLVGGYFHLQVTMMMGTPECTDRGTRVEVEKVTQKPRSTA